MTADRSRERAKACMRMGHAVGRVHDLAGALMGNPGGPGQFEELGQALQEVDRLRIEIAAIDGAAV